MDKYTDRTQAGFILAKYLKDYARDPNVMIMALPRGGVPVAFEIATALSVPLDVLIVRKLGLPGHEELAIGATASGHTIYFNEALISQLRINRLSIAAVIDKEKKELQRREQLYRGSRPFPELKDKKVILVDDGIATGSTIRAAIEALHEHKPKAIIIAVPVAAQSICEEMASLVETIICPLKPVNFEAVGLWYKSFPQTSDNEVIELLQKSRGC